MDKYIVVIGGYGHVGQDVCRELGERYPGRVYAAGRNLARAEQFSRETGGKVKPMQIDIKKGFGDDERFHQIGMVTMCLDQTDTAFIRSCLERGIHYVDVTANLDFLEQVEQLHEAAASGQATAVLSVGLAPGLTNLMAHHAALQMDRADTVDISIMLGLGDRHGKAAIEWTVDSLSSRFDVVEHGRLKPVTSFSGGRTVSFGPSLGRKTAYRFPFPDQRIVARTLGIPTVSTRLCFDSAIVTRLLAWFKSAGGFRLLSHRALRPLIVKGFGLIRYGQPVFAVKVDAKGVKNGKQGLLQGAREAAATAQTAVFVADKLFQSGDLPHGVYHIEQLFRLEQLLPPGNRYATLDVQVSYS
ncbi:saccharopine dehydrogenase family protein [Paenibacillus sp. NPDC056579]|uniref:saccharopine dehydrogenase family protein n=1 Tax=Paenibacillus sp. NPDC056579 TaxID=3345871 RepID=UPI0036BD094D